MWYKLSGLKQLEATTQKLSIIIDSETEEDIRDIFKKLSIVVLSIGKYIGQPEEFGKVNFRFQFGEKEYSGVSEFESVEPCYNFLINTIGLDITYINNYKNTITDEQVVLILRKLQDKYKKAVEKKMDQSKVRQPDDEKVKKLKEVINSTIVESESLISSAGENVSSVIVKTLKDAIDEMKKQRMGTNYEKLGVVFENLIRSMEEVEVAYMDYMKKQESDELKNNLISDLDIISEYDKYKKVKKLSKLSGQTSVGKHSSDYKYYSFFGKGGIFMKLFIKELKMRTVTLNEFVISSFSFFENLFLFLILELIVYYIFLVFTAGAISQAYYFLWNLGIVGFLLYGFKFLKTDNILLNIGIYILIAFCFYLLRIFIAANFAF